jgi:hypothetical protein
LKDVDCAGRILTPVELYATRAVSTIKKYKYEIFLPKSVKRLRVKDLTSRRDKRLLIAEKS